MQNESDYLVRNRKLVIGYLTDLFNNNCIITAHFGAQNDSFLTAILLIDPTQNTLKLDYGPSDELSNKLLNASKILFRTEFDGIKVSFSGKGIKKSYNDNFPALELPIPNALFWMERREFYRVRIPMGHVGSLCKIRLDTVSPEGDYERLYLPFSLADLSIGGFAFLCPDMEHAHQFYIDKPFTHCSLFLHESSHAAVSFTVKSLAEIRVNSNTTQLRVGCLLDDVSPTFESAMLRYMQNIERMKRNIA